MTVVNTVLTNSKGEMGLETEAMLQSSPSFYHRYGTATRSKEFLTFGLLALAVIVLSVSLVWLEVHRSEELESLRLKYQFLEDEIEDIRAEMKEYMDVLSDEDDEVISDEDEGGIEDTSSSPILGHLTRHRRQLNLDAPANRTSEGLRLYESLIANKGRGEPRSPEVTWDETGTESGIKPYHRISNLWPQQDSPPKKFTPASANLVMDDPYATYRPPSTATPDVVQRRSRVKFTNDGEDGAAKKFRIPRLRHNNQQNVVKMNDEKDGEVFVKVYQEFNSAGEVITTRDPPEESSATSAKLTEDPQGKKRRRAGRGRKALRSSRMTEFPLGSSVAAHFVGDSSRYDVSHRDYEGNGHLRNAYGIFRDWKTSSWMNSLGQEKNFQLNVDGEVTVVQPGLYYIYAQINYLDAHVINGYHVYARGEALLQCTTMTQTGERKTNKVNTCFTAGIALLQPGDTVAIRDLAAHRYSIMLPEKSFFGLIRIGPAKNKSKML